MKKLLIFISLITTVPSCVKEVALQPVTPETGVEALLPEDCPVFKASVETAGKASIDAMKVLWAVGDEISISDNNGHRAVYRALSSGQQVSFVYNSGDKLDESASTKYTAWYPSNIDSGHLICAGSIPMKAISTGSTDLQFKNLTGLVRLSVQGPFNNLRAIVLTADKPISGQFDVSVTPGQPAVVQSGSKSVQINIADGNINSGKDYYVAVPAGSYSSLECGLLFEGGIMTYFRGAGLSIARSQITTAQTQVTAIGNGSVVNLSDAGASNCYLATQKRDFSISFNDAGAACAEILWKDADVIRPAILHDGKIWFRKNLSTESFTSGNAVLAVRDNGGNILKTWHIWAPGEMALDGSAMELTTNAGVMMDRNLGATSATSGNAGAIGLYYQWGRSMPLRTSADGWASEAVTDTGAWLPAPGVKGASDPCPPGWHVPDGGGHGALSTTHGVGTYNVNGTWATAFGTGFAFIGRAASGQFWSKAKKGMDIPSTFMGGTSWFPAGGELDSRTGALTGKDHTGSLWTRTSDDGSHGSVTSFCMTFGAAGFINPTARSLRTAGRNVRCVK